MIKDCGCVPNQYMCGKHKAEMNKRAWLRLKPEQQAYDKWVTSYSRSQDGCSCHISAPCSYCTSRGECESCGGIFDNNKLDDSGLCFECKN